jgi:Protein of unknown function (DUF3105)
MARTGASSTNKTPTAVQPAASPAWRKALVPGLIGLAVVVGGTALVMLDPPLPGEEYLSMGNAHLATIDEPHDAYNSKPGSSGPHFGSLAGWEVHETPVPNELFIHNLEDRGVVLAYNCPDGCQDLADGLAELWAEQRGNVLVTPFEGEIAGQDGTTHRAAAVAWARVYYFDELNDETVGEIKAFIRAFEGIDHHPGN